MKNNESAQSFLNPSGGYCKGRIHHGSNAPAGGVKESYKSMKL